MAGGPLTSEGSPPFPALRRVVRFSVLALALAILCYAAALAAGEPVFSGAFARLFFYEDVLALAASIIVLAVIGLFPPPASFARLLEAAASWTGRHILLLSMGVALAASLLTLFVYRAHPVSMDEYAAVLQGELFARGKLFGTVPAAWRDWVIAPQFQNIFILFDPESGRFASSYWPGYALLRAPFAALGLPWLCNPVLAGLTLLLFHRTCKAMPALAARADLAALMLLAAPAFWAYAISYYSTMALMLANLACFACLLKLTRIRLVLAGVIGSLALTMHNPVPHILFAIPVLLWVLKRWRHPSCLFWLGLGYLPLSLLFGLGWALLRTGFSQEAIAQGEMAKDQASDLMVLFHAFGSPGAKVAIMRLAGLVKMWAWDWPGALLFAFAGFQAARARPEARLLLWASLLTFAGYFLVPVDQGHGWGYRYFFPVYFTVPMLAALAMPDGAGRERGSGSGNGGSNGRLPLLSTLIFASLVFMLPFRLSQMASFVKEDLAQLPDLPPGRSALFIKDQCGFYAGDLIQNAADFTGNALRFVSHGAEADAAFVKNRLGGGKKTGATECASVWRLEQSPIQ